MPKRLKTPLRKAIKVLEDLIIQKVTAGRSKDWMDVEALLLRQRGKLDKSDITNWLSQFAEALEKPEMLIEYRRLVEKINGLT